MTIQTTMKTVRHEARPGDEILYTDIPVGAGAGDPAPDETRDETTAAPEGRCGMTATLLQFRPGDSAFSSFATSSSAATLLQFTYDHFAPQTADQFDKRVMIMIVPSKLKKNSGQITSGESDFVFNYSINAGERACDFTLRIFNSNGPSGSWRRAIGGSVAKSGVRYLICPKCFRRVARLGYRAGSGGRQVECEFCFGAAFQKELAIAT
jgi:hypothetical protein